jgi:hypothetical protein
MISPWIAFLAWLPISLYFFYRHPIRVAILVNFIAGWALLPTANFTRETAGFPYWILGTCLPSIHFFTKATVPALTCLLGVLLVNRHAFTRCKLSLWDLPMLVWCIVPMLSALANFQGLAPTLRSGLYQTLAWGVPYLVGRLYFSDTTSLKLAAKAVVIAGLAYVPFCLIEILTGPQIYAHLYGYQPYQWVGAQRYFGFRPIGLLEDGNQLGIWMATSALLAIWLWRRRLAVSVLGIPIAWASGILFVITLLCQSGGSVVLLFCLLPFLFVHQSYLPRLLTGLLLLGILGAMSLRLANVISLRSLVEHNGAARSAAQLLMRIGRGSFGWRLSQDERHVASALEKPALGTAEWDWWKASQSRPWGLWLLSFGMYGIAGLFALETLQLLPVARVIWLPARDGGGMPSLRGGMAALILMSAIDNLLNGSMILPLVIVIGGLSAPSLAVAVAPEVTFSTKKTATASRTPMPTRRSI